MQIRVVESQFAPPLVVLGCVPVRARCAEARVLHLLSQTRPSRRRTTSLRGRGRKDRADQSRRIRPVLRPPNGRINIRQSTTITSPQIPLSDVRLRRTVIARELPGRTVHTCTHVWKEEALVTHVLILQAREYACKLLLDERGRKRGSLAVFRADCDGADVEPIACSRKTRRANRCRVVSRNREHRAASTRSYHRPESLRRAVVSEDLLTEGRGETTRISQPRQSWGRILRASR